MSLDGDVRRLFEQVKDRRGFPPRAKVDLIRNQLTRQGLGRSTALGQAVTDAYLEALEATLDEFMEIILDRSVELGLQGDDVYRALNAAHHELFDVAHKAAPNDLRELPGGFQGLALSRIGNRQAPVWDHLHRAMKRWSASQAAPRDGKEREQNFGILWSRNQATKDFADWVDEARQWSNPISILFIDLDHFKQLNERYGHVNVDEKLFPEAQMIIARHAQGRGAAYRYGGEEFLVILPNHDTREAEARAEEIRRAFEERRFEVSGTTERVTVSIGVATWPDHGETYDAVLEVANGAEREAKGSRNVVKVARPKNP